MAALEVDLSKIEMGQTVTVKWRGKPVFVRRRSEQEVEAASKVLSGFRAPAQQPRTAGCAAPHAPDCRLLLPHAGRFEVRPHLEVMMMSSCAEQVSMSELRDPEPDSDRATNPEVSPVLIAARA